MGGTWPLLILLWETGTKALRKKAKICQEKSQISWFSSVPKQASQSQLPQPDAWLGDFLGFLLASARSGYPIYPFWPKSFTKPPGRERPLWEQAQEKAFTRLRKHSGMPSSGTPAITKCSFLYTYRCFGTMLGVLTQMLGSWDFFFKKEQKQFYCCLQGINIRE